MAKEPSEKNHQEPVIAPLSSSSPWGFMGENATHLTEINNTHEIKETLIAYFKGDITAEEAITRLGISSENELLALISDYNIGEER